MSAFQDTVLDLREYADHQSKGQYIIPVFDDCKEFMGQAKVDYAKKNMDRKLGSMHVSNMREYVQLQAADLLASEYRTCAETLIKSGELKPGRVLEALQEHQFHAKMWDFEHLDYLRRRVEAVNNGIDPETAPFAS